MRQLAAALLRFLAVALCLGPFCLAKLTDDEARMALRDQSIVFLGDSISRYQYLSLAAFAEFGEWPSNGPTYPQAGLHMGQPFPNPIWERNFHEAAKKSWDEFYRLSNLMFRGTETCDCYRKGGAAAATVENRYYHNPTTNTSLAFIKWFGSTSFPMGHLLPKELCPDTASVGACMASLRARSPLGCVPGKCDGQIAWKQDPVQALKGHISELRPTVVVVNTGAWKFRAGESFWDNLASAGVRIGRQGIRAFWRTNAPKEPCTDGADMPFGTVIPSQLGATKRWLTLDAFTTVCRALDAAVNKTEVLQKDSLHLTGRLYHELNLQLLSELSPMGAPHPSA